MQIDWAALAQTPGYRSLKAAYMADAHRAGMSKHPMRTKQELYKTFRYAIDRAKHYAIRTGRPVSFFLDAWEAQRDYWWLNFYQDARQPKLPSGKPRNVEPMSKVGYWKLYGRCYSKEQRFKQLRKLKRQNARVLRRERGKKPRL